MTKLPEFLIDVTVVYVDGQAETITLKHRDYSEELALSAVQDQFRALENIDNIERMTTTINTMFAHAMHA